VKPAQHGLAANASEDRLSNGHAQSQQAAMHGCTLYGGVLRVHLFTHSSTELTGLSAHGIESVFRLGLAEEPAHSQTEAAAAGVAYSVSSLLRTNRYPCIGRIILASMCFPCKTRASQGHVDQAFTTESH
jgi:hypothetical protein